MRIVYLCNEYPPYPHGGIGSVIRTLATSLAERGHDVNILGTYIGIARQLISRDDGVSVIRLSHAHLPRLGFVVDAIRKNRVLAQLHRGRGIDLVEGQEGAFAFVGRHISAAMVIRMHGGHQFFQKSLGEQPRLWPTWQERASFNKASYLCAVSAYVASETRRINRLAAREIRVLPNPVDTTLFRPCPDISEESGLIIFAGSITKKKGVFELFQALSLILQSVTHARLLVLGRDTRDKDSGISCTELLLRQVDKATARRIEFNGHVPRSELPSYFARAQVCVFPSHIEAQGLVVLEAMATQKAVVASNRGPGPEIIDHGISGLLCDPGSPSSIAEQVVILLKDRQLRQSLGSAARWRVEKHFSTTRMIPVNEAYYSELVQMPGMNRRNQ